MDNYTVVASAIISVPLRVNREWILNAKEREERQQKIEKNRTKLREREVKKSIQLYQKWDQSLEISSTSTNSGPNTCDTISYKKDNCIDVDRDNIHDSTYQLAVELEFNNIPRPIDDYSRIILLWIIILFNANRPNLIDKNYIKHQQHLYMYLLQRYLRVKYSPPCEANVKFLRILNILYDMKTMRELHIENIRKVDARMCSPLMREILATRMSQKDYDLKYPEIVHPFKIKILKSNLR
ncbi:unnamed protein product [Oppiella nova]|uniref:Uncharacterized protein n=1 Tax=Oppiella nova TaxID=334625 RepID=A0A7R9LQY1_9ACAR|nr:unnamed protein product [Oppiella nova]CAG2166097.1 unnamed protein product [Oppiella nova]